MNIGIKEFAKKMDIAKEDVIEAVKKLGLKKNMA